MHNTNKFILIRYLINQNYKLYNIIAFNSNSMKWFTLYNHHTNCSTKLRLTFHNHKCIYQTNAELFRDTHSTYYFQQFMFSGFRNKWILLAEWHTFWYVTMYFPKMLFIELILIELKLRLGKQNIFVQFCWVFQVFFFKMFALFFIPFPWYVVIIWMLYFFQFLEYSKVSSLNFTP